MLKIVFALTAGFAVLAISACGRTSLDTPTVPVPTAVAGMLTATPQPEITVDPAAAEATVDPAAPEAPAAEAVAIGDAAAGQALFNQLIAETGFSCAACHTVASQDRLVGPGLLNIASIAATRVEGQDAITYLHYAIVDSNQYVVEGYPASLMPLVYGDLLTEQQVDDLVAYMLTLGS